MVLLYLIERIRSSRMSSKAAQKAVVVSCPAKIPSPVIQKEDCPERQSPFVFLYSDFQKSR